MKNGGMYMKIEEIVKQRVEENQEFFSKKEIEVINNNFIIMKKIYLLGLLNGKEIYGNKFQ